MTAPSPIDCFRDAKFGLFMHFGLPSIPAGVWDGKVMGRNWHAEWIRMQHDWPAPGGIPREQYDALIPQFASESFDADLIISEAARAGMKSLVVTTKHHDGAVVGPTHLARRARLRPRVRLASRRPARAAEAADRGAPRDGARVGRATSHRRRIAHAAREPIDDRITVIELS